MYLSIKNDEAHQLATELAKLTGESLTSAVTVALRERRRRRAGTTDVITVDCSAVMASGRPHHCAFPDKLVRF